MTSSGFIVMQERAVTHRGQSEEYRATPHLGDCLVKHIPLQKELCNTMGLAKSIILSAIIACASCSTVQQVSFICDQQDVEIYVNDEYAGRDLVKYTLPQGCDYVIVSCRRGGEEIYSRRFYVKGKGNMTYELNIPVNYRYSDKGRINR